MRLYIYYCIRLLCISSMIPDHEVIDVDRFLHSKWVFRLLVALMIIVFLYMLMKISPLLWGLYSFAKKILTPFIIAVIISYVLHPIVNLLHERKVPRPVAVLLIYAVFIASVTVIMINVIPMLIKQLRELNEHLPQLGMKAQSMLSSFNRNELLPPSVREGFNRALLKLEESISSSITTFVDDIGSTISTIFIAFIVPFLVFYMLKDIKLIERSTLTFVPKKHRREIIRLLFDIDQALGNYIRGQFIVCVIIGVCAYLGYLLVGMPYALLLASLVAVFNIIPYLGPFFGAAPALIMASTISLKMMLLVITVNLAVQILEGNVISPQVVGRSLHIHPLMIILALMIGGELAGVVGLILAVPFFAVLKVIWQHVLAHLQNKRPI